MKVLDIFIINTIRPFLIVFGIATGLTLPFAIDINFLTPMFGGLVDYTPSSVPALRHWGIMVFGIGVLMAVAAKCPSNFWKLEKFWRGLGQTFGRLM
jgi:hypothetical protein